MKIIRAGANDTDMFNQDKLNLGACCFFTEDRQNKYFFKIENREATLFTDSQLYIPEAINKFLFYSGFVSVI